MTNPTETERNELLAKPVELFTIFGKDDVPATAYLGLSDSHLGTLIHQSRTDEELLAQVPDDTKRRFPDAETAIGYIGSRQFYSLVRKGELAGVVWFGASEWKTGVAESPSHTYAIRMYGDGRGTGLAGDFSDGAIGHFMEHTNATGVWLEVNAANTAAVTVYERTGWVDVDTREKILDDGTVVPRRIMQLDLEAWPELWEAAVDPVGTYRGEE